MLDESRLSERRSEVEAFYRQLIEPRLGRATSAWDAEPSADASAIAFTGAVHTSFGGRAAERIWLARDGKVEQITFGPGSDRLPRWSPDGRTLAFASDRNSAGVFAPYLLRGDAVSEAQRVGAIDGTVEMIEWSGDGTRLLIQTAGLEADAAGAQGSGGVVRPSAEAAAAQSWEPHVTSSRTGDAWRRIWLHDVATDETVGVPVVDVTIWDCGFAGPHHAVAIVSDAPDEGSWYTARLVLVELATGALTTLYTSSVQLGVPAGSPSGRRVAVSEAFCSDRTLVAGDLVVVDVASGTAETVDSLGVDVTGMHWRDDDRLCFIGIRGFEVVVGVYDVESGKSTESWVSTESCGVKPPAFRPVREQHAFAVALQSYEQPFRLAVVADGEQRTLATLADEGTAFAVEHGGVLERVSWRAPDGLEIQGYLVSPHGDGPFPLVVLVHGGPVTAYTNKWDMNYGVTRLLVTHGYAVLHPNPRGSTGRGQEFARRVHGDMGGADVEDFISGVDHLAARGLVDPNRVAVMGGSYGGFMSAWLAVKRPDRFAAAISLCPVTNWFSMHYTCNIPEFCSLFLDDQPTNAGGAYHERSPVMFASAGSAPTLVIAGELDRCTPPEQAQEMFQALALAGATTSLAIYPGEAHGVRGLEASIDFHARTLLWLERFLPRS